MHRRQVDNDHVEVAGHKLEKSEYTLLLDAKEGLACQALPSNDTIAVLDTQISEELRQEGQARDLIRLVQQARKEGILRGAFMRNQEDIHQTGV